MLAVLTVANIEVEINLSKDDKGMQTFCLKNPEKISKFTDAYCIHFLLLLKITKNNLILRCHMHTLALEIYLA